MQVNSVGQEIPPYLGTYFEIRKLLFSIKHQELESERLAIIKSNLTPKQFNKEFGHLAMTFGRQTGATYWLSHQSKKLLEEGYRVTIVAMSHEMIQRIQHTYMEPWLSLNKSCKLSMITPHMSESKSIEAISLADYVFVDVFELINSHMINLIYAYFYGKLIVLL